MRSYLFTYELSSERLEEKMDPDRVYWTKRDYFTDVTDHREAIPPEGIALIFSSIRDEPAIHALAAFTRKHRIATDRTLFKVWGIEKITPVPIASAINKTKASLRPYATAAFARNTEIPPATATALLRALMEESGELASAHRHISSLIGHRRAFDGPDLSIRAQEKDAVTLSLDIFGMGRGPLMPASTNLNTEAPFLSGVETYSANEDAMIWHDTQFFEGVQSTPGSVLGSAIFELPDGRKLTVFNANRGPIERALGVDLVYYNHTRNSYLMLQYKRMIREARDWRYRGDAQFYEEVRRMQRHNMDSPSGIKDGYRLNPLPFYFKFIRTIDYSPGSLNLLPGLYVPLEHLTEMISSPEFTTTRGNLVIDHESTPRLEAKLFTGLAQDGLIGSRGTTTEQISRICNASLSGDRSVILSVEESSQGDR
ncbi:hypothetical protein [Streptomyces sp. CC219B]|uniref:hypothetical protein n=1 Tax=Streptomyces sp. CC219B TaxID=3044574 RepID=UPI0024A9FE30|nr:hypothetical protein [Streptomyces sp. CC219B]